MPLSLTILIIAISLIPLKIAIFEVSFAIILCTPVLAYLIALTSGLTSATYLIALVVIYVFIFLMLYKSRGERKIDLKAEALPIIIFVLVFNIVYSLTQKWPDFIAMGERLRDYAILSSVIQSPVDVKEPWMSGYPLNYYAFWYRFGHMLSSLLTLKTWEVYHLLQSFTYALYFTCAFRFLTAYLGVKNLYALFFSILICFGSNLAGIKDFVYEEPGWWGPSRVIPGAINEFPAWSLLLGDLHPHYLNLPLLPFFVIFLSYIFLSTQDVIKKLLVALTAFTVCPLWIANSNVWEIPLWLLFAGIIFTHYLIEFLKKTYILKEESENKFSFNVTQLAALISIVVLAISLFLSRKNIVTPEYPVDFVKDTVARTKLHDMSLHFGIPLFIITTASIFQVSGLLLRLSAVFLAFYTFFFNEALPLLIILVLINVLRINKTFDLISRKKSTIDFKNVIIEATGLFSLLLLIVPEIVFLNDPYGADIERMNTIFKVYSAAWYFIHVYAFCKLAEVFNSIESFCKSRKSKQGRLVGYVLSLLLIGLPAFIYSTGFFFVTIGERTIKNEVVEPRSMGLSELERLFPGSAETIKFLSALPKGIMLEAQGKPYDYTSMISTLSEHPSFIGWVNHVNLLLNNIPEVGRRERLSDEFYNTKNCDAKAQIIKNEGIKYVIFGPLEKLRHPEASESDFSCLSQLKKEKGFIVYSG